MKEKENAEQYFEEIIKDSFKENDRLLVPDNFATKMTRLYQNRLLKKRLFEEWGYKIAFTISVLAVFVFIIWFSSESLRQKLLQLILDNTLLMVAGLFIVLFVFFFDQVILKIMFISKKQEGLIK